MPDADPAHYVRGQYDGYRDDRRRRRRTRRPRPTPRCGWRSTTGAGRACPFFIRTGKRLPVTQTELRLVFRRPPRLGFSRRSPASRARTSSSSSSTRRPASGCVVDAQRADESRPEPITLDMEFADEGGEGPTPYEVLLHAAMIGDSTRFTRQDGVEETWRIMQPLLDDPPPVAPVQAGLVGPEGGRRLLAGHGRWRGPWIVTVSDDARRRRSQGAAPTPRARPRRRRSRRSRTTRSCPTATPARWSRPTARSTGCACRAFDSRACSAACSTAGRATSGSARTASTCPTARALRPRDERAGDDLADADAAGSMVRDALTMGPRDGRGRDHAAHPSAGRRRRRAHARAHRRVPRRARVEVELVCEPAFDYGRAPATWTLVDDGRTPPTRVGAGQTMRLHTRPGARRRGQPASGAARARAQASAPTARSRGRRIWPARRTSTRPARRIAATTRFWRRLARAARGSPTTAGAIRPALGARRSRA